MLLVIESARSCSSHDLPAANYNQCYTNQFSSELGNLRGVRRTRTVYILRILGAFAQNLDWAFSCACVGLLRCRLLLLLIARSRPLRASPIFQNHLFDLQGWRGEPGTRTRHGASCRERRMLKPVSQLSSEPHGHDVPKVVIYAPPMDGLPYLVVALSAGGLTIRDAQSRCEAREIAMEMVDAHHRREDLHAQ